jgi:hypothetical protein
MLRLFLLPIAVATLGLLKAPVAAAHEFPAPVVSVVVSLNEPGSHPNLQTTIDIPDGPGFEQVRIVSPPASRIAADADIPDGTVVGRLDGVATTNAIALPECNVRTEFSVPIVEATTDVDAPGYPAYLRELAPGQHRLRLVADVSPSPDIPILINYLFDINTDGDRVVTHAIVGDPTNPPATFRACTPQRSVNTLFGVTPDGTPLLTSPGPIDDPRLGFAFTFTSRPDGDGHRHEQALTAVASVGAVDGAPAPQPTVSPEETLTFTLLGDAGLLNWTYPEPADSFTVYIEVQSLEGEGHSLLLPFQVPGSARSFDLSTGQVAQCRRTVVSYRVTANTGDLADDVGRLGPFDGCGIAADDARAPSGVRLPDTGAGSNINDGASIGAMIYVLAVLVSAIACAMLVIRRSIDGSARR